MQNSPDQRGFAMIDVAHEDDTEGSGNRGAETGERIVFRIHRSLVIRAVLIEETVTARISFASCSNSFVRFSATNPSSRITYCLQVWRAIVCASGVFGSDSANRIQRIPN